MIFTNLQDSKIREQQYREAINFYLYNTKYKIVFCNNSGEDISLKFKDNSDRIEFLSFNGNNYNKNLGKGYGEFFILQYAFQNSEFIKRASYVIKITGRLIIENISLIPKINDIILGFPHNKIYLSIDTDSKFVDSRCIIASKYFFDLFLVNNIVNDSQGYFFEHMLLDIINEYRNQFLISDFCVNLRYCGVSGTSGNYYTLIYKSMYQNLIEVRNFCEFKKATYKESNMKLFCWISIISFVVRVHKAILKMINETFNHYNQLK